MIRFQRSIRVSRGRVLEAIEWAKEITEYINSKQPNFKAKAFSSRFGDISTLVWQIDFDDLAALDKYEQFFNTDPGYWELIQKGNDFFVEGSIYDSAFDAL
jgi:hypothetical protein